MWSELTIAGLFLILLIGQDSLLRAILVVLRVVIREKQPLVIKQPVADAKLNCAVVIAAHNEAEAIAPTVTALISQLSGSLDSQVQVIADRCQDATAQMASQAGAIVSERSQGLSGKCAALAWWLQNHPNAWQNKQAIVILDADSRLREGALLALQQAIANGADAAQAFLSPQSDSRSGRLSGWSEILMQRIDDDARRRCGWQVPLRGTGMVFRPELLAELAPKLHTMAEDLELDVLLAARKARVAFVPEAVVLDPKPQNSAGAARQRARWLRGQLQVLRAYWRRIGQSLLTGGLSAWFLLPLLFLRPKTFFIALRLLLMLTGLMSILIFSPGEKSFSMLFQVAGVAAAFGLLLDMSYYLAAVLVVDDRKKYLTDLLAVPRYFAMWVYSFGVMTVRRGWLRARG